MLECPMKDRTKTHGAESYATFFPNPCWYPVAWYTSKNISVWWKALAVYQIDFAWENLVFCVPFILSELSIGE